MEQELNLPYDRALSEAVWRRVAPELTPFAPLLFKSKTVLTPSGLVDGMTPTASDPFYGFADWSFHLSGSES